jgi:hypothetical protein
MQQQIAMALIPVHLVAHLREHVRVRLEGERAAWLWKHLRRAFPHALACTLMGNHVHLFVRVPSARLAQATFVKVLGAFARAFGLMRPVWRPVPAPSGIEPSKVLGLVRYLALNPPRARVVSDPLAWYWSTHLDICGAIADPWVTLADLRPFMRGRMNDIERMHAYVSGDPSVHPAGTPLPKAARDTEVATRTLDEILLAAAAATRGRKDDHRRRGPTRTAFVWLAATQGWRDIDRLAKLCDVTNDGILKILRAPPPTSLDPARLVLGDARLMSAARRSIGTQAAPSSGANRRPRGCGMTRPGSPAAGEPGRRQ